MDQTVSIRPRRAAVKAAETAAVILAGMMVAAMLIGWLTFLIWLAASVMVAFLHWI